MTPRERVHAAASHRPPDRVPIDLNITFPAYAALLNFLDIHVDALPAPNSAMEVIPDSDVLSLLGVDLISVKFGDRSTAGSSTRSRGIHDIAGDLPESISDAWGLTRRLIAQKEGAYYEITDHPLAAATIADLGSYAWPGSPTAEKIKSLKEHARGLYRGTELALVGRFGGPIMEIGAGLLGMEEWYARVATDGRFVSELLNRISDICTDFDLAGIEASGEYLQIVKVSGEDLGAQNGPLYSPEIFREVLLPPLARRWRAVRKRLKEINPDAKIMLHSCGAIRVYIPELIQTGAIDILDPVQPLAAGMHPNDLKRDFGEMLVFHGGIDVQRLLPFAKADEVVSATHVCLAGFEANRGGFILAPSHTVQADVPPANLVAMIEAAKNWTPAAPI